MSIPESSLGFIVYRPTGEEMKVGGLLLGIQQGFGLLTALWLVDFPGPLGAGGSARCSTSRFPSH